MSNSRNDSSPRRPTLKDVAEAAAVGVKTVSRVVNGESGVSATMRAGVEAIVEKLQYRPDVSASNLRRNSNQTKSLGLLLEDLDNPFSSALNRAVEDTARKHGYLVFSGSSDEDPAREREMLEAFCARRVDGLVIVPAGTHEYLDVDRRAGVKIVFVDRRPADLADDFVVSENRSGVTEAIGHLCRHGHTKIAYLGGLLSVFTATERFQGYRDGLDENGLPFENRLVRLQLRYAEEADAAARQLLESAHPPTAIFASQVTLTIGALAALKALGAQRKIAVISYDDFSFSHLLEPPITVIAQDPVRMGREAAEQLIRRIEGDTGPPCHMVLPTKFIPRGSGELPPSETP